MDSEPTILYMDLVDSEEYLQFESNTMIIFVINKDLPKNKKSKILGEIYRKLEIAEF